MPHKIFQSSFSVYLQVILFHQDTEELLLDNKFVIAHIYVKRGKYTIEAKAIDIYSAESDWAVLEITVPRTRATSYLWYHWFLECFPLLERLLSLIRVICAKAY